MVAKNSLGLGHHPAELAAGLGPTTGIEPPRRTNLACRAAHDQPKITDQIFGRKKSADACVVIR
jgi:hypothetical protein